MIVGSCIVSSHTLKREKKEELKIVKGFYLVFCWVLIGRISISDQETSLKQEEEEKLFC